MIRVTMTIALCFAALAVGAGTAGAATGPGLVGQPAIPVAFADPDEPNEEDSAADRDEVVDDDDAVDADPDSEDAPRDESLGPFEVNTEYVGSTRLRGLRKMPYLATCPEVDCELSVDVELRFVGGRRVVLASPSVTLKAGQLERLSVRVTRAARRLMRRAARSDQKVLAVATVFSWNGTEPTPREPIRTRLR